MPSRHLDPEQARRYAEYRYDFNRKSLAGRVVLVPGGAGGLGAAIAALLVQDGAIPVVGYRSNKGNALAFQQRSRTSTAGSCTSSRATSTDPQARKRYLEAALAVKGEIYGVVALTGDPARVKGGELDGAALHASFTANFEAPVLLARAAAEEMLRRDTHGSIVLVSSMQGVFPFEGSLAYASPKAALVHAAKILAKEYGGTADIRVNVVAPGATVVGMARASIDGGKYDPYVDRGIDRRASAGPRTWPARCASCSSPTPTSPARCITVDGGLTLRRDRLA